MRGSEPLRVLHLGKFYPPHRGGMETHLADLARALAAEVDVHVVAASSARTTSIETVDGVRLTRAGRLATVAATPICPSLYALVRRARADVVHIHHPNPYAMAVHLAAAPGTPLVITYHTDIVRQRLLGRAVEPLVRASLASARAILVTSGAYLDSSETLRRYRHKCHVVPLGVDPRPVLRDEVSAIRRRFRGPLILAVGRLVYYKGFEYLIDAMRDVPATLLIIGSGPLERDLRRRAEAVAPDRVVFLGNVPDVAPYHHAADVFVLASVARSEAFGLVQLEAMAAGVAVVNTTIETGVTWVSPHGETGLSVAPCDAASLARAISTLLADDELRRRLGEAGRRRAREHFSTAVMARATLNVYRHITTTGARLGAAPVSAREPA